MSFELNAAFSLSIMVGAVIGWCRVRKSDPAFFPFLLLLTVGLLNEVISIILIRQGRQNVFNYNLYGLVEALLLAWQFLRWGLFKGARRLYYSLQVLFVSLWVAESLLRSFKVFNSYFIMLHSFLLVLMSISMINRVSLRETLPLWRQPVFLICTGLVIYHDYAVVVEAFWIFGLNYSDGFRIRIYEILSYINLFTNLLFAFAIIWIPTRLRYILQH
jgi:hypothetical protein